MKEFKFKVWDKKQKRWWIPTESPNTPSEIVITSDGRVLFIIYEHHIEDVTEQVEIVFYTGLKDENRKEIYEGDIVEMELEKTIVKGKIKYHPPSFHLDTDFDLWDLDNYISIKKIGNIYEKSKIEK